MCSHGWNTPELFVVQIQPEILVWAFKVDTPNLVGSLVLATETADIVAGSKKTDRGQLEASASAPSKDEAEKASETTTLVSSREGQPAPEDEPATKKFKLSPQKKIALKAETEEVLEESSFIEPPPPRGQNRTPIEMEGKESLKTDTSSTTAVKTKRLRSCN